MSASMNSNSLLNLNTRSPLILGQSQLKPKNSGIKKKVATLMITSLVDAFSILVIYLLFGPAISGESTKPELGITLPVAYQSQLTDQETNVIIKDKHYFIQDREVKVPQLAQELKKIANSNKIAKGKALVIIADQKNDMESINPVLIAASEAGLSQLRLAVEHQGE